MAGRWICAIFLSVFIVSEVFSVEEGRTYHGTIREDATEKQEVELDLPLYVRNRKGLVGDEICGYTVYKSNLAPIPFQILLLDHKTGGAKIVLAKGNQLNYEATKSYEFEIAADDCVSGAHSVRDLVHIDVEDVNEFQPVWKEQTYIAEVKEGQLYEQILKLEATDADGSDAFSKICKFHLRSSDVPFTISDEGYLQNTEPLDYSSKHNYILEVQAEDCGKKLSDRLLVNILVKPECRIGWKGVKKQMDYVAKSGRQLVTSNASLEMCTAECQVTQLSVNIRLHSVETETDCEVHAVATSSRSLICGVHADTISLLTNLKELQSGDEKVKADGVVTFDGKTSFTVAPEVFSGHLESRFTISTWLKHQHKSSEAEEIKQHLLCNADGEGMNRHHYSLFLHNCRLVLLLRKEPGAGVDMNVFQPAEWRWKLPEVCDDKWHHYTINMEFPEARLFVDGKLFVKSKHSEDVIDDWPLHPSKKVHSTKLVVGACWEGSSSHLSQFLNGQLAGLTILNNDTESDHVISCINSCHEKIDFHAINEMDTGMSVSMNSAMTQIDINGHTIESVENLVSKIGYVNPRVKFGVEATHLMFETAVKCADGNNISVATSDVAINFVEEQVPKITLGGSTHLMRDAHEIIHGERLFRDLLIIVQPFTAEAKDFDAYEPTVSMKHHLDLCSVVVTPHLNVIEEHMTYPENLIKQLGLVVEVAVGGITVTGEAKVGDYVEVMRGIRYIHRKVEDLNSRSFQLTCSKDKGLVKSNVLTVELDIIHSDHKQDQAVDHAVADKLYHSISNYKVENLKSPPLPKQEDKSSGVGIAAVVVICVGFLVFIIVLGVIRIRTVHQRSVEVNVEEKQEMEWDNSALTITVNPMDSETVYEEESVVNGLHAEETDTDDDIGSFHDDRADSSDEDEPGRVKSRDLEWDSTTATY